MSLLVLKTIDDEPIPNGRLSILVEDSGTWKTKEYDEKVDSLSDVVGVTYPKSGTNGRITANPDGYCFLEFDYFAPNEDLTADYETANTEWDSGFNPAVNEAYVYVATCGMVAVEKIYFTLPSSWKKLKTQSTYDIYAII